ncbi:MAG: hypothetical protein OFPII_03210 [Osedax symbiont Rs1]|nr:MAG: hypothetical protein OFPII_03210 [Osedax symbiont Rs1]
MEFLTEPSIFSCLYAKGRAITWSEVPSRLYIYDYLVTAD